MEGDRDPVADDSQPQVPTTSPTTHTNGSGTETTAETASGASPPPDWLGSRVLPTDGAGVVIPQKTPPELDDHIAFVDHAGPVPIPVAVGPGELW